jgi:alkanesulfonate monooxygenase SsuD/methylene tetrahydromethanopterin reductase-like flavin-dependent oxidoreductase (luciferase family)
MHNLSGGRGILGVGRGTVPREAEPLGTRIGSFDNPDKAEADRLNREQFDEIMDVILLAYEKDEFAYHGRHYDLPPPGIPDRGSTVQHLTLVPRPLYPYEIWQPITSPPTLEQVPVRGFGGVFWLLNHAFVKQRWERYEELYVKTHGAALGRGEKRMLVLNVRIGDTREGAVAAARPGHDEFWKFLGPYGWSKGYMTRDGKASPAGLIPTLEESLDQKVWLVGTPEDVAEGIQFYRDSIGLENLTIFPHFPGETYEACEDQLVRYHEEVRPLLGD